MEVNYVRRIQLWSISWHSKCTYGAKFIQKSMISNRVCFLRRYLCFLPTILSSVKGLLLPFYVYWKVIIFAFVILFPPLFCLISGCIHSTCFTPVTKLYQLPSFTCSKHINCIAYILKVVYFDQINTRYRNCSSYDYVW